MVTILFSIGEILRIEQLTHPAVTLKSLQTFVPIQQQLLLTVRNKLFPPKAQKSEVSLKSSHTKEFRLTALLLRVKRLSTHRLSQAKAFLLMQARAVKYSAAQSTAVTLLLSKPQNISATVPQQEFFSLLKMPPLKGQQRKAYFKICLCLHTGCCTHCSCNRSNSSALRTRSIQRMALPCACLSCSVMSVCYCYFRTSLLLFGYRCGIRSRCTHQGRKIY